MSSPLLLPVHHAVPDLNGPSRISRPFADVGMLSLTFVSLNCEMGKLDPLKSLLPGRVSLLYGQSWPSHKSLPRMSVSNVNF
jgi:hypothetical protein